MDHEAVKAHCRALPGTTERDTGEPANVLAFKVGKKTFAYFKTSEPERWRFSVRVSRDRFLELTDQPGIKPARFMGRYHWVTIIEVNAFDPDYLVELIHCSYERAIGSLSKRAQREIGR